MSIAAFDFETIPNIILDYRYVYEESIDVVLQARQWQYQARKHVGNTDTSNLALPAKDSFGPGVDLWNIHNSCWIDKYHWAHATGDWTPIRKTIDPPHPLAKSFGDTELWFPEPPFSLHTQSSIVASDLALPFIERPDPTQIDCTPTRIVLRSPTFQPFSTQTPYDLIQLRGEFEGHVLLDDLLWEIGRMGCTVGSIEIDNAPRMQDHPPQMQGYPSVYPMVNQMPFAAPGGAEMHAFSHQLPLFPPAAYSHGPQLLPTGYYHQWQDQRPVYGWPVQEELPYELRVYECRLPAPPLISQVGNSQCTSDSCSEIVAENNSSAALLLSQFLGTLEEVYSILEDLPAAGSKKHIALDKGEVELGIAVQVQEVDSEEELDTINNPLEKSTISPSNVLEASTKHANVDSYSYFASNGGGAVASDKSKDNLEKLFESYRDRNDEPDTVGTDGVMKYLMSDLQLNIENAEMFIPLEIIQAPSIGEMTKEAFVNGWKAIGADTISKQRAYIGTQISQLSSDMTLYKRVYRYVFVCAREKGQKALPLDQAITYWEVLFAHPGMSFTTSSTSWTTLWFDFLNAKWTKSVNKDMWNMTLEFLQKATADETLSFWNEDGAWPSVVDDFVAWVKERRGDTEKMETD